MMTNVKVAVVTGSNRGIGFEIVRNLCKMFDGDVILTARTESLGLEAIKRLEQESGVSPVFHQLDITDIASIERLHDFLQDKYGGLDVLVNNAGIMFKSGCQIPLTQQVMDTMKVNFWGCLNCCEILFPILHPGARVVNLTSMYCRSTLRECASTLKTRFTSSYITMKDLEKLIKEYEACAEAGNCHVSGWPTFAYGLSSIGITVLTKIQQQDMDQTRPKQDILINACCPGWCKTDMGGSAAVKTAAQGADTPIYLSLLRPNAAGPRGALLSDRMIQRWE